MKELRDQKKQTDRVNTIVELRDATIKEQKERIKTQAKLFNDYQGRIDDLKRKVEDGQTLQQMLLQDKQSLENRLKDIVREVTMAKEEANNARSKSASVAAPDDDRDQSVLNSDSGNLAGLQGLNPHLWQLEQRKMHAKNMRGRHNQLSGTAFSQISRQFGANGDAPSVSNDAASQYVTGSEFRGNGGGAPVAFDESRSGLGYTIHS